jgi:predicted transcriptional regulator
MDTEANESFDAAIRFRAPKELVARLRRIAAAKVKTLPEIGREACVQYADRQEGKDGGAAEAKSKQEEAA